MGWYILAIAAVAASPLMAEGLSWGLKRVFGVKTPPR